MKKNIAKKISDFGKRKEAFLLVIDYKIDDIMLFPWLAAESDVMFKSPTMSNISEEKFTNPRDIYFS